MLTRPAQIMTHPGMFVIHYKEEDTVSSPDAFEVSDEDELVGVKIGGMKGDTEESAESEEDGSDASDKDT